MILQGKVAIVTGSTSGIGEGIARGLAAEGAAVVISGRRATEGERVVQDIQRQGGTACFVQADLAQERDCVTLVQRSVEQFRRLDILVNNAGIFPSVPLAETTAAVWDEVFAVNVRGAFLCSQAAIPEIKRQGGGSIINIGSTLVFRAVGERIAYACSKGALLTMTKTMARELVRDRIRVNWITVGWVVTPGEIVLRNQTHGDGRTFLEQRSQQAALGRLETPEDMASGVVYLASDAASHVTGCELNISGGSWI